jgi:predicted N-acetyltransferase YhbS
MISHYQHPKDYEGIYDFLTRTYPHDGKYHNWLASRWEYMISHPMTNLENLNKCGIWEDDGKIIAFVNYEMSEGEAFIHYDPSYPFLKKALLDYAMKHLSKEENGVSELQIYLSDFDHDFIKIAYEAGFEKEENWFCYRAISAFDWNHSLDYHLPAGYKIICLNDENDLKKMDRLLWRGFNHSGEAPLDGDLGRKKMQSSPNFRKDLNVVVVAPGGNYVAYSGMFYDAVNQVGYVEPVATDPDYRRLGLGKAAVLESVKRVRDCGAQDVFVESAIDFYGAIGFKPTFYKYKWIKKW